MLKNSLDTEIIFSEAYLNGCRLKVGKSIREIREKQGLSQEQLAEKMNISRSTISKIESGKFNCSIDYLSKFAIALGFEVIINKKSI